jgi:uncharacterized protein (DUF2336 family)
MIVRQFLRWIQTAPPGNRAEATSALARAYLYSDLSDDDRMAAEAAMIVLLDDPSPLVRLALAEALANSDEAPHGVIIGLAHDQPDIATIVINRSPVLCDAELVDLTAAGGISVQSAVAGRQPVSRALAGAVAEVAGAAACLVLIENPYVDMPVDALARVADRHGRLSAIREALLDRDDLPAETRQGLVARLSETLARFVADRDWISEERARKVTREACDRATVAIAAGKETDEVASLVRHLVASGQLTGNLLLRALLCGHMQFLIEAFAALSGVKPDRVAAILSDRNAHGFRALYERAGLPAAAFGAFRVSIEVMNETGFVGDVYGATTLKRRMIERVLTRYESIAEGEFDQLLAMLRRYAAEAAREEARYFTADLVAAA